MARPHIEFIQAQTLPWRGQDKSSPRPGAECKLLSADPESQAISALYRYPAGWQFDRPHHLTCDEEVFVIAGDLSVGSVAYQADDYAFLPADMPRPEMNSNKGAVVLTFFEGAPNNVNGELPGENYDSARLIARVATADMPWSGPSDPVIAATMQGVGKKSLRRDPITGDSTWMLRAGPDDPAALTTARVEVHPVVEEVFLLDGEITMNMGTMRRGGYFWRPAGIAHGPFGTKGGLTGFFRTKGGALSTDWSDKPERIDWNPSYNPVLPPDLRDVAMQAYDPTLAY